MATCPRTPWHGGLGRADVYSGDLGSTIYRVATRSMRPPEEEGTSCLLIAFLGDKTPVVGHVGMRALGHALAPTPGLLEGDPTRDSNERREGKAGRCPLGPLD
jgi:hypothetical protein